MMARILRILLIVFALGIAGYAATYLGFEVKGLLHLKGEIVNRWWYKVLFYGHIAAGMIALSAGSLQFLPGLRLTPWHRRLGLGYILGAVLSAICGAAISFQATGGMIAGSGFFTFSMLWLLTTLKGLHCIRQNDVTQHLIWMHRSYALALGAVTLRIWLLVFPIFGLSFITAYQAASWGTWIFNIALVELLIIRIKRRNSEAQMSVE